MNWTLSIDEVFAHGPDLLDARRKAFYSDTTSLGILNVFIDSEQRSWPSKSVLRNYALRLNNARK